MFRTSRAAVLCLGALLFVGRLASAQSVDDIIAQNLQAKGGPDKIKSVTTIKQTSHVTLQGATAELTAYGKRPNLSRQEVSIAGQQIVSGFDGTTAWALNPLQGMTTPTIVTGEQADVIKEQSDFDGPLVDYKAKGYTASLVGTETVDGKKAYHLKLVDKQGRVQQVYLDTTTALEIKIVSDTASMGSVEQLLGDYRDVSGFKMPFSIRSMANGKLVVEIAVDKIEVNLPIEDAFFKMPGKGSLR